MAYNPNRCAYMSPKTNQPLLQQHQRNLLKYKFHFYSLARILIVLTNGKHERNNAHKPSPMETAPPTTTTTTKQEGRRMGE